MIGKIVSHYRIMEKIGQGGMGEVFLADDTSLHRKVALKFLPPEMQQDAAAHKRFIREARSAAALDHPYICSIHEVGESEGQHFIVMEYVDGHSLKNRLEQGPLPLEEALPIAIEVTDALEAAHGKGIIHRDVKPANIMLTQTGHAKVMDFGLAKQLVPSGGAEETVTALTSDGSTVGTLAYMSPEQLRSQAADARSDIWALGVTLYEMAAGVRPFHGQSGFELTTAIMSQAPRPIPSQVPAALGAVIERCLEKEPRKRYQSAFEVRAALEAIRSGTASLWAAWQYRLAHRRWLVLAAALVILAAVLVGLDVGGLRGRLTGQAVGPEPLVRLAVLPFANAGGNPDAEYLCQGISESLISDLSRLPNLSVLSRDSVFRFAAQAGDIREVGRELGAGIVLRGRVTLGRDFVSISAELVRTRDDMSLWREQYNRSGFNFLEIEQDIAREVAQQLRIRPGAEQQGRMGAPHTVNPEAYRSYLLGRYYWNTRTDENLKRSAEAFQQAVSQDPNYALGWAGLADSFLMLGAWSLYEPTDSYPRAKAAAMRAIAIDEALAEPHATLGYMKTLYEWDWAGAGQEFRRAIQLNAGYATTHHWYAFYYQTIGDIPRSLAEIEAARQLDPLSPVINSEIAYFYRFAKQYDRAELEGRKVVDLDPSVVYARILLAHVYAVRGKRREAAAELETLSRLPRPGVLLLGQVAVVYGLLGERDSARAMLQEVNEQARQRYVSSAWIAAAYAVLGEKDQAIACLERSLEDRSLVASWLRDPDFDALRSEPRFRALFERLGLKP